MTLPVKLLLAFTLVAVVCERCGAAIREDGELVCPGCGEAPDDLRAGEIVDEDDEMTA